MQQKRKPESFLKMPLNDDFADQYFILYLYRAEVIRETFMMTNGKPLWLMGWRPL